MDFGRFELLDITISPDQELFLLWLEKTLDHYTASEKSGVWIERHLKWLEEDEEYQRAYEHLLRLIDIRISDTVLKQAIFGQTRKTSTKNGILINKTISTGLLKRLAENTMDKMKPPVKPEKGDTNIGQQTVIVLPAPDDGPQLRYVEDMSTTVPESLNEDDRTPPGSLGFDNIGPDDELCIRLVE